VSSLFVVIRNIARFNGTYDEDQSFHSTIAIIIVVVIIIIIIIIIIVVVVVELETIHIDVNTTATVDIDKQSLASIGTFDLSHMFATILT
jgi:preprotein translocase subunit SecY